MEKKNNERIKEEIMEKTFLEYIETRMNMFLEMYRTRDVIKHGISVNAELIRLYDNIKELCSCADYCFIGFTIQMRGKLDEMEYILQQITGR